MISFWLHPIHFSAKNISGDAFTLMLSCLSTKESIRLEMTKLILDIHLMVL